MKRIPQNLTGFMEKIREQYKEIPGPMKLILGIIAVVWVLVPDPIPLIDEIIVIAGMFLLNQKPQA